MSEARDEIVRRMRATLLGAIHRSVAIRDELCTEITQDIYLVDGGVNLQWLAESALYVFAEEDPDDLMREYMTEIGWW